MSSSGRPGELDRERFFPGDSEMAGRMRAFDWSKSDLGSPQVWPENLRIAVSLCLTSRFPIILWWGPTLTVLYNDAYIPFLGETKHPRALSQAGQEVWGEIWELIGPMLEGVRATGQATWSDDFLGFFARKLPREEAHVRFTYGPILSADGRTVDGIFCPCTEITADVVGARRLETLRKLGGKAAEGRTVESACREAARVLAENSRDIPFVAVYVVDEKGARATLAATAGLAEDGQPLPPVVSSAAEGQWPAPLASVLRTHNPGELDLEALGLRIPGTVWPEPARSGLVLPVAAGGQEWLAGLLVVGVSPRQVLDAAYRTFFDLVAGHISTALADARAYEAERQRAEALAEIDRVKTAFFSNVSHEFRTPLTLMLGPVEDALADETQPLPQGQRQRLETVHRGSLRLLKLVNTLLDFSRIETGRAQAAYEPTDLARLTAELASNFHSACDRAGLRLVVDCPPLPEPVYVDRDMWEKVVLNLLSNAFKFTFEGEIAVRLRAVGDVVELTVRDTGTGIPAGELPRIFERFHRVEGSRGRTHEGTGIGLALVQELVKLHGGSVRAESTCGQGSNFAVSIPRGKDHLPVDRIGMVRSLSSTALGASPYVEEVLRWMPDEETSRSFPDTVGNAREAFPPETLASLLPATREASDVVQQRPRVLWADDNADLRRYVRRLLSGRYEVEAVGDGQAALAAARARPPDLVLADVMMPRLDGFGLLNALRADHRTRTIPVILLSARAGEESHVEGLEAGADDYLVKPFSARELLARVGAHVQMNRLRQEASRREQALLADTQAAKQRLETVLQRISDGFVALDRDFRYTALNDQACESMGMCREEILGRSIWGLFPDTVGTAFETELRRAAAEQKTTIFEYYYPKRDRWYENRVYPSLDGSSIFFVEITERKQVETVLRESQERVTRILDSITDGMVTFDPEWRFTYINGQAEQALGRPCAELLGKCVWEEYPANAGTEVERQLRRAAAETITCEYEGHDPIQDRWYDNRVFPMPEGSVAVYFRDVTDRKRAEEALRESEARFRNMADNSPVGVWVTDASGACTYLNEWWYRLTGQTPEQGVGFGWLECVHPDDREGVLAAFQTAIERQEAFRLEYRLRRHGGECGWAIDSGAPRFGESGGFLGHVGSVLDVTQEKRQEEALREAHAGLERRVEKRTAELARANEALEAEVQQRCRTEEQRTALLLRLATSEEAERRRISRELHDQVGQQLTSLTLGLKALRECERSPTPTRELLERLQKTAEEVGRELHDLALRLRPTALDDLGLPAALRSAVEEWSRRAGVEVDFHSTALGGRRLSGEAETALYRVVLEALHNVHKHAGARRVSVIVERRDHHAVAIVEDDGVGFDTDAVLPRPDGGRLGLLGMRERMVLVAGSLEIESTPGVGTTVFARIPLPPTGEGGQP